MLQKAAKKLALGVVGESVRLYEDPARLWWELIGREPSEVDVSD
jgi:hypothetical protein